MITRRLYLLVVVFCLSLLPASAMHIMEGFLPMKWCLLWGCISLPFVVGSYIYLLRQIKANPRNKISIALSAAYVFVLSALKLPSVTGSSSHLTGTTLGTLTTGPMSMPLVGFIVLLFQALLLAHGGLTTLGANIFSLSIAGPFIAYGLYRLLRLIRTPWVVSVFLATFCGSMGTYVTTSFQLALAFPDTDTGVFGAAMKFLGIFATTQLPLAILEGVMTVGVLHLLHSTKASSHPISNIRVSDE